MLKQYTSCFDIIGFAGSLLYLIDLRNVNKLLKSLAEKSVNLVPIN